LFPAETENANQEHQSGEDNYLDEPNGDLARYDPEPQFMPKVTSGTTRPGYSEGESNDDRERESYVCPPRQAEATQGTAKDLIHHENSKHVIACLGRPIDTVVRAGMISHYKAGRISADCEHNVDKETRKDGVSTPSDQQHKQRQKKARRNECEVIHDGREQLTLAVPGIRAIFLAKQSLPEKPGVVEIPLRLPIAQEVAGNRLHLPTPQEAAGIRRHPPLPSMQTTIPIPLTLEPVS
jgi:hypothetical protein